MTERKEGAWKSFWLGTLAAIVVAMIAGVVLTAADKSTAQQFSTPSTRL